MILTDSLKWSCGAYATSGVTSGVFACAKFTFVQDEWVLGRRGGDIRCTMLINFLLHQHRAPQVLVCTFGRSGLRHKLLLILSNPSSFVPHDNLIKSEEFFLHSFGYVNLKKKLGIKIVWWAHSSVNILDELWIKYWCRNQRCEKVEIDIDFLPAS